MTNFRVRPVQFRERAGLMPMGTVIMLPPGCDVREVYEMDWRDLMPACPSLASKARLCVEHDRHCVKVYKQRLEGGSYG